MLYKVRVLLSEGCALGSGEPIIVADVRLPCLQGRAHKGQRSSFLAFFNFRECKAALTKSFNTRTLLCLVASSSDNFPLGLGLRFGGDGICFGGSVFGALHTWHSI